MSGTPTEAEIQAQLVAAVDILESARSHVDGTQAGAGGKFDTLLQALEGEFTPQALSVAVARTRALFSSVIDQQAAIEYLTPIIFEYMNILDASTGSGYGAGAGTTDIDEAFAALYQWFVDTAVTVGSRAITYDASATLGGANVGDGLLSRLTEDENAHDLEACHVEKKLFRCIADQNSGTDKYAETFEAFGEASSFDAVLNAQYGSGEDQATILKNHHAGTGDGSSLLTNASFSTYNSSGTPKFTGWTESAGGSQLSQDTANYYSTDPGIATPAALKITGGGGTVTIKQTLANMRASRLDPNAPYFFRIMVNKDVGTAAGGSVTIRMGSSTATVLVSAIGAGWQELRIASDQNAWFSQFNEDPFDVEIEWSGSTSGTLLVDSAIFAPWDLFDGTYWFLRNAAFAGASPAAWQVDDVIEFIDTGGAPATGKIQYWLFAAGLGYLPHSGTPTIADP